ncbi:MAG: PepSY domain-containing protein [Tannerella sp.]|jgi:uncharacterized iron-regulated membrane protein|nr:PepSY domain-containing protein [Tannerella sp.]
MNRVARRIHLWLSVPFGLVITVICFSGAMLVFETEVTEWSHPERYRVRELLPEKFPLDRLAESVQAQLPDTLAIGSVSIASDRERNYRFGFAGQRTAAAYVDPYSGEIRDLILVPQQTFFFVMRRLHRWLMGSFRPGGGFSPGKTAVGVSTLVFVLILLTGLLAWIPKTKKALKGSLGIHVRYGWKRFWHDLHVAGGVYSIVMLLALSLTGLTWSFTWYRNGFYRLFGAEPPQMQMPAPQSGQGGQPEGQSNRQGRPEGQGNRQGRSEGQGSREGRPSEAGREGRERSSDAAGRGGNSGRARTVDFTKWQAVADRLIAQYPDFKTLTVSDGRASISVSSMGNSRASDTYLFDAQTGAVTEVRYYRDLSRADKLRGWIYSVHVGSWGGPATRILAFLAALAGASLPLTGYYMWIKRIRRREE